MGGISRESTHPFREKHITLVHNGTLTFHKNLANVAVDSHAICHSIADIGYKETVKKIEGAFTLIWWDSKQKSLNLIRNSQRPLFVLETKDLFIFVSEKELGLWICSRNNVHVLSVEEVPTATLYQFSGGVWDKYETESVLFHTPTFWSGQKSIVPYKPQNTYDKYPVIGNSIVYIPLEVAGFSLIGEWEDPDGVTTREIKSYCHTVQQAKNLLACKTLLGDVIQVAYDTKTKTNSYVVKNVRELILKKEQYIGHRCDVCTGGFTPNTAGSNATTCSDCVQWVEKSHGYRETCGYQGV